jgi:hypothetical protein
MYTDASLATVQRTGSEDMTAISKQILNLASVEITDSSSRNVAIGKIFEALRNRISIH